MKTTTIKLCLAALGFIVTLNACKKDDPQAAIASISTIDFTDITTVSAISGGNVTSDGGAAVTVRGVCWSLHSYPTTLDSLTIDGGGNGQFSSALLNLTPGTVYYVRAYAANSAGTAYGTMLTLVTLPVAVGDTYGGGIVAYILKSSDAGFDYDREHGIICAPADLTNADWGPAGNAHAQSSAIGAGFANTENIVLNQGAGTYAAKLCYDLTLNTYSDWYLPSIYEFLEVYAQHNIIGGFTGDVYWSSSEINNTTAWAYETAIGSYSGLDKSTVRYVRPVRSF